MNPSTKPGYTSRLAPRRFTVGDRVTYTYPDGHRTVTGVVTRTTGSMCDAEGNASWLTTIQPDPRPNLVTPIPVVGVETSMEAAS